MNFGLMSSNVHSINNVSFIFLTKKQTNNTTVYYPICCLLKQTACFYIQALHVSILQIYL